MVFKYWIVVPSLGERKSRVLPTRGGTPSCSKVFAVLDLPSMGNLPLVVSSRIGGRQARNEREDGITAESQCGGKEEG